MNSKNTYTVDTSATSTSREFSLNPGILTTIEHAAVGGSPNGAWSLERYNRALGAWREYDTGATFTDPSGSDAGDLVVIKNLPSGLYRMRYTRTSGGASSGGTVIVEQSKAS